LLLIIPILKPTRLERVVKTKNPFHAVCRKGFFKNKLILFLLNYAIATSKKALGPPGT
jgi:hypothetical protein